MSVSLRDPLDEATLLAHKQIRDGEFDEFADLAAFHKDLYSASNQDQQSQK